MMNKKWGFFFFKVSRQPFQRLAHSASFSGLRLVDLKERFCQPPFYDFLMYFLIFPNFKITH